MMTKQRTLFFGLICTVLLIGGCSSAPEKAKEAAPAAKPEAAAKPEPSRIPDTYTVQFATTRGNFVVEVHRAWAPIGAERFYDLVKDGYYDGCKFFRVIPNFVAQWGIAATPAKTKKWDKPIKDDAVARTNKLGSIVYATAGRDTRTTQVFINLRSNQNLDSDGFAPFGEVVEGMDIVEKLYKGYADNPDQEQITKRGNAYLNEKFPNLDSIKKATML
jgi:peptidyl-prolyl cis-trans isomerase A (cyclophilin A)